MGARRQFDRLVTSVIMPAMCVTRAVAIPVLATVASALAVAVQASASELEEPVAVPTENAKGPTPAKDSVELQAPSAGGTLDNPWEDASRPTVPSPMQKQTDRSTFAQVRSPSPGPTDSGNRDGEAEEDCIMNLNGWLQLGLYAGPAIRPDVEIEGSESYRNQLSGAHWGWGIRAGFARALSSTVGVELALSYFRADVTGAHSDGIVLSEDSALSFMNLDILLHVLPKEGIPLSVYGLFAPGAREEKLGSRSTFGGAVGVGLGIRYFPFHHLSFDLHVRYEITGFEGRRECNCNGNGQESNSFYGSTLILLGPVATFW